MADLTSALSPGRYEDVSSNLPGQDDLRHGEVDLELSGNFRDTNMDQPVSSSLPVRPVDLFVPSFASPAHQFPSSSAGRGEPLVSQSVPREFVATEDESSFVSPVVESTSKELIRRQGDIVRYARR